MKKVFSVILAISLFFWLLISSVGAVAPPPNWDISGTWDVDLAGYERQFVDLVQDAEGNVSGDFWWYNGSAWLLGGNLNGYVSGNDVHLHYDREGVVSTGYEGDFEGTITKTGMSGRFTDTSGNDLPWSTTGSPTLLYEARITGGGQLINGSGEFKKNDREIDYKISFGMGLFLVNGQKWLDGATVVFHHVSVPEVETGTFEATCINSFNFNYPEGIANCNVSGTFNGEPGYSMWIRVQDGGEPSYDNIRFELWKGGSRIYDTYYTDDFPGESETSGTARHYIEKGNLQVEDLR